MPFDGEWRIPRCRTTGRGLFFLLLICSAVISSCSRDNKGFPQTPQKGSQLAGPLQVKVLPEDPTSSDTLFAMFSGPGSVAYSWEKNGSVIEGETTSRLSPSHFTQRDRVTAIVQSGNNKGSVTVVIGNLPLRIISVSFLPTDIHRGVNITAVPKASDPGGGEVRFSYKWSINGEVLSDDTPVLKGDRFKSGDKISLVVVPSDNERAGAPYETAMITVPKASPWFDSTPSKEFSGSTYTYRALARDPDGGSLTYSLASAPRGMTIDAGSGMITWAVTSGDTGIHMVEVIAGNPGGAQVTQRYSLTIRLSGGTVQ